MPYESVAELMLSLETKRHIKSKKKRIRKKYYWKNYWLKRIKDEKKNG